MTSATTTMSTPIPTGAFNIAAVHGIRLHYFIQKYWWLRSPYMGRTDNACFVRSNGGVDYYDVRPGAGDSYGRSFFSRFKSPVTDYSDVAWLVFPSGSVYGYGSDDVMHSYGKDEAALIHQISIKMVVKIAVHDRRQQCAVRDLVWYRLWHRHQCHGFLRAHLLSPYMVYGYIILFRILVVKIAGHGLGRLCLLCLPVR